MNRFDIKRVIEKLEPDNELEYKLAAKLNRRQSKSMPFKPRAVIAAGLVMAIGAGAIVNYQLATKAKLTATNPNTLNSSSVALLPADKGNDNPVQNTQKSNSGNVTAAPPENKETPKQESKSQNVQADNTATQPSVNSSNENHDGNSEAIKQNNETNTSQQQVPANEPDLVPKTLLRHDNNIGSNAQFGQDPNVNNQNQEIVVPKVQLPTGTINTAKMMGLIVYQGRIYLQNSLPLDLNSAEKLVGEKLGTTTGNITEWNQQKDNAVDLSSTVGVQDVYTVKGYDKSFRIMTYGQINGQIYAQLFECLNGITVKTGTDVFSKFKLENNIDSVNYEDFDSWNSGRNNYKPLTTLAGFNTFLAALENSLPQAQDSLANLFDNQNSTDEQIIDVKLQDGTEVELRLFKEGYVYLNGVNIFFKVDSLAFNSFWNELS
ncbi:hypothetical protein Desaci_4495 [Desulfosporosinus acidiphilus SJ4]|uniref:Uncharacterized protein n=1 Tax=Desulfosporosinus acidiphilus (strain DSM 22704 / JCM 16185 / SJ4) TaxID=646529 RepID=I4DC13_DESAJ|nr:hypothetical protein [Desulfosporosinus acidiphilus]AFM43337.1 hypothetical protein Desaci_4495 [Desulfosporosinus acidiphilus SJ4]